MRIWDLPLRKLCRQHLLGEHNELHVIFRQIYLDRKGWRHHPEVKRWEGHLPALFDLHDKVATEMLRRGFRHESPLDAKRRSLSGSSKYPDSLQPPKEQVMLLRKKCGECLVFPEKSKKTSQGGGRSQ